MSNVRSDALDAYNPFDNDNQSAMLTAGDGPPIINSLRSDQAKALDDLQRKQAELDARSAEIDRREQESRTRAQLENATANNWPPLPSCCTCKPCFRVDFDTDFTDQTRPMAKMAHYLWYAYFIILLVNLFGALSYMIIYEGESTAGALFGSSILILIILPIYSFLCWNRPLYKALKKDSSLSFFAFFLFFAIQIVLCLIQSLGIHYLGSCGWINGVTSCMKNKGVCAFMLVIASAFTVFTIACVYLIFKVHSHFRGSGANMDAAKREAAVDFSRAMFSAGQQQPSA